MSQLEPRPTEAAAEAAGHPEGKLPLVRVGDAFDLLADLKPASVDLICTSPPYWGLRTYGFSQSDTLLDEWKATGSVGSPGWDWYRSHGGVLGMEPYPEWYVEHIVEILGRGREALKPEGNLWVNLGDTYFARWSSIRPDGRQGFGSSERLRRRTPAGGFRQDKQLLMLPARVAIAMQEDRWILRNDLIWAKPHVPPRPEKDRLRLSHEHFFHFVKRSPSGRPAYYYDLAKAEDRGLDVVDHAVGSGRGEHSATFPEALVLPRIESSSPEGGFVVDPFCGSGTCVLAALRSGRSAQGFELSPAYAQAARARVRRAGLAQSQIRQSPNSGSTDGAGGLIRVRTPPSP